MSINDLLAAGIEIQGNIKVIRHGEHTTTWKANSVYSLKNDCRDTEIKYIYPEDDSVVYEIE